AFLVIKICLAMKFVGAALGDGCDHAAGGTAVLCGVDAGVNGELADGVAGSRVGFAGAAALLGKEGLVVIRTIDFNVVEDGADAADADKAIAAGVNSNAGGHERQS